jgi:hypothetical protein
MAAPSPPPPLPESPPRRLHDAANAPLVQKARDTFSVLAAFTLRPRATSALWATGDLPKANPLFLMAASAAVVTPLRHEFARYIGSAEAPTLLESFLEAVAPYTYYAALGLVAHVLLWPFTRLRPARASLGMGLVVGASIGSLVSLETMASSALLYRFFHSVNFLGAGVPPHVARAGMIVIVSLFGVLVVWLALLLAGAHRISPWRTVAAVVAAVIVCGFVIGALPIGMPVTHFWWRPNLGHPGMGFGFNI